MAPRPSSSGISRSIVTTSGSNWWTLRTASKPSRAVATTRNSPAPAMPSPPPRTSESTRRISALSSTTRTLGRRSENDGIGAHRPDFHPAVRHEEAHGASRATAHGFAHDWDPRATQHVARGGDVALAHLHGARRHELGEHARAAYQLGDEAARLRPEGRELLHQEGHGGLGQLGEVGGVAGEALRREEDMGHGARAGG